jgi:hypothetical protein
MQELLMPLGEQGESGEDLALTGTSLAEGR